LIFDDEGPREGLFSFLGVEFAERVLSIDPVLMLQ